MSASGVGIVVGAVTAIGVSAIVMDSPGVFLLAMVVMAFVCFNDEEDRS